MASPIWWTWVWVNSGSWWLTGRPVVLQFTRSQRVGHDWAAELNAMWLNTSEAHFLFCKTKTESEIRSSIWVYSVQVFYSIELPWVKNENWLYLFVLSVLWWNRIYNGILFTHKKNEILPFMVTWMGLEGIILSGISQKDIIWSHLYTDCKNQKP